MSSVFVSIGQCGNQIATSYFDYLQNVGKLKKTGIGLDDKLRSVFVDSEHKVVENLEKNPSLKKYIKKENIILGRRGRGSNWSYGYYGCSSENHLTENVIQIIRKEAERCDCFCGTILMHSLAGGTGSGLGSWITEQVRDQFGVQWILNCVVAPHGRGGESPLQHYNTLLALNKLLVASDALLLFHNDALLHQLHSEPTSAMGDVIGVNQRNLNSLLAHQMASLLSPCSSLYHTKSASHVNMEPWELIRSLCPFTCAKFMRCASSRNKNIKSQPQVEWSSLASSVQSQMRRAYDVVEGTISAVCSVRGDYCQSFASQHKTISSKIKRFIHPVDWNPYPVDFWIDSCDKETQSITLATNSGSIVSFLESVYNNAYLKFNAKAYVHWYLKHGSEENDFTTAFENISHTAASYRQLTL